MVVVVVVVVYRLGIQSQDWICGFVYKLEWWLCTKEEGGGEDTQAEWLVLTGLVVVEVVVNATVNDVCVVCTVQL